MSRKASLQCSSTFSRGMANNSTPAEKKESSEIVAPEPVREVLVADVISGAPGAATALWNVHARLTK